MSRTYWNRLLECGACFRLFLREGGIHNYNLTRQGKEARNFCSQKCHYSVAPYIKRPYYYCINCDRRFTIQSERFKKNVKHKFCSWKCRVTFFDKPGNFPQAWNKGKKRSDYMSQENELRVMAGLAKFKQEHGAWNKGKPHTEAHKIKLRLKRKNRVYPYEDTKPERIMQIALALNNVTFQKHKQFRFGGYRHHRVDIFIEPNICVEVDGIPFHTSDEAVERDKWVNSQLLKQGMTILRFTDTEVIRDAQKCVKHVLQQLQPILIAV